MPSTININGLTLAHKGSGGTAAATLPDVCKTPSPGGPVPLPYPNLVMASDLAKGTATVTADGGNPAAIKGSEISRSTGDEAGTVGGLTSSTFMKEATWILYSFDVFLEGSNACRLTDKMLMNHQNTVCLAGWITNYLAKNPRKSIQDACQLAVIAINEMIGAGMTGEGKVHTARGLEERIRQNTVGGRLGGMGAPNAPVPEGKARNGWQTHDEEITKLKLHLKTTLDEFDAQCGGFVNRRVFKDTMERGREAQEWENPTAAQWTGPAYVPPAP